MGNDGALSLRRKDIVFNDDAGKEASRRRTRQLNEIDLWTKCALTGGRLEDPVVSDYLGRLYNKESILEWLLSPEVYSEAQQKFLGHIQSLRDVVELKRNLSNRRWVCPVSNKDILKEFASDNFIYFAECGHVFANTTLKNIQSDRCFQCDKPVDTSLKTIINPYQEDRKLMKQRLEALKERDLTHSLAKIKRKRKKDDSDGKTKTKK